MGVIVHRAKRPDDRFVKLSSKFLLVRMTRGRLPDGYFQGVIHNCEFNSSGVRICTESGKFLDIQVIGHLVYILSLVIVHPFLRQIPLLMLKCWEKVLLALM